MRPEMVLHRLEGNKSS